MGGTGSGRTLVELFIGTLEKWQVLLARGPRLLLRAHKSDQPQPPHPDLSCAGGQMTHTLLSSGPRTSACCRASASRNTRTTARRPTGCSPGLHKPPALATRRPMPTVSSGRSTSTTHGLWGWLLIVAERSREANVTHGSCFATRTCNVEKSKNVQTEKYIRRLVARLVQ